MLTKEQESKTRHRSVVVSACAS